MQATEQAEKKRNQKAGRVQPEFVQLEFNRLTGRGLSSRRIRRDAVLYSGRELGAGRAAILSLEEISLGDKLDCGRVGGFGDSEDGKKEGEGKGEHAERCS